ncbi:inositol monophosphatase family protein [Leptolyngbya sp. FACHB-261]|uniref:inositol monophosphatase family protein n=1 Tax=Leptolyngbya sp. FACHB-261 TaxID=2692806 RepID=UPI001689368D|nr:inositol monophosphatase family protein [Leptolyngbya sp. FACHB-261]MBD2100867.1 inositol monophosphatase [Leptolyngbya sp. FACHB-261]
MTSSTDLLLETTAHASLLEFLEDTEQVVKQVGLLLLSQFGQVLSQQKADGSLVTQADRDADTALVSALRQRYPHHSLLTEEGCQTFDGAEWCWVIDPLDGTTNFAQGVPIWGISVALLHQGRPLFGLGHFPPVQQTFWAAVGEGAFLNGNRLRTRTQDIGANDFFNLCSRTLNRYEVALPCKPRILGSAAHNLMAVANSSVRGGIEATPKAWDLAAAWVIVPEAGGVVRTLSGVDPFPLEPGQDYTNRSFAVLAAGTEEIWQQLRACLREAD